MIVWKMYLLSNMAILGSYVRFQGCNWDDPPRITTTPLWNDVKDSDADWSEASGSEEEVKCWGLKSHGGVWKEKNPRSQRLLK